MSTAAFERFFALLSLGALAIAFAGIAAASVAERRDHAEQLKSRLAELRSPALLMALAIATVSTLGSLYLSEIAHYPPCELCWFQRIAMYPSVVWLTIASIRRDFSVGVYLIPVWVIGLGISVYHYIHERFPNTVKSACSTEVPCSTVWVWEFHFVSIPFMAGAGFLAMIVLSAIALRYPSPTDPDDHDAQR